MPAEANEEKLLRSAALQNAQSILLARQQAEQTLVRAKEALERKTVELAASLALIRATLEATTDGILATDDQGRVTSFNEKFVRMWGIPPEVLDTVEYIQLQELFTRQVADPVPYLARVREIYASRPPEAFDQVELKDGRVFERYSNLQRVEGRPTGRVWCFRDITDRKRTERELQHKELALARLYQAEQQARGAAEQANKAKDQFLAALSHELRTPLTPMLAILSNLGEGPGLPAALAEDFEILKRNVELESRLIDDLLDLTRVTRGKLDLQIEPVLVDRLVENAINTCRRELTAKRLTLVRDLAAAPPLLADGTRITQVLWNLLKNAIKFTPEGGVITLRSRVTAAAGAGQLAIAVEDTGLGIERGQLDHLFEAFEQGGRKVLQGSGGLGLGLAISKGIAEAHGGTLTAASAGEGRGSTFTLILPIDVGDESRRCAPVPPLAGALPAPRPPKTAGRPARLLLVEDHADTAAILSRLLRRTGYDVVLAATLEGARQMAAAEMAGAGLDLVLSDLGLPDGSGLDLMRELSSQHGLRGIALSGFGMDTDIAQSLAAGFSRHLIKPINVAALRGTIAELIREE